MSKKLTIDFSQNAARIPVGMKQRVMVSEIVENVELAKLHPNPLNIEIFQRESQDYFARLTEDIRKRGIIVPLLAKRDGTLLSGHNRLEIAKSLGLKYAPVQYINEQLSEDTEREFLIKDNLFRRQFSTGEWAEIYRRLVPEYEAIIQRDGRGGDRKSANTHSKNIKKDSVLFDPHQATTEDLVRHLQKETGDTAETIRKRIQRGKKNATTKNIIKKDSVLFDAKTSKLTASGLAASRKSQSLAQQFAAGQRLVTVRIAQNKKGQGIVYQLAALVGKTEHTDSKAYRSQHEAEAKSAVFKRALLKSLGSTAKILEVRVKEVVVVVVVNEVSEAV